MSRALARSGYQGGGVYVLPGQSHARAAPTLEEQERAARRPYRPRDVLPLAVRLSDRRVERVLGPLEMTLLGLGLAYELAHGRATADLGAGGMTVLLASLAANTHLRRAWSRTPEAKRKIAKDPTSRLTERRIRKGLERLHAFGLVTYSRGRRTIFSSKADAPSVRVRTFAPGLDLGSVKENRHVLVTVTDEARAKAAAANTHGGKRAGAGRKPANQAGRAPPKDAKEAPEESRALPNQAGHLDSLGHRATNPALLASLETLGDGATAPPDALSVGSEKHPDKISCPDFCAPDEDCGTCGETAKHPDGQDLQRSDRNRHEAVKPADEPTERHRDRVRTESTPTTSAVGAALMRRTAETRDLDTHGTKISTPPTLTTRAVETSAPAGGRARPEGSPTTKTCVERTHRTSADDLPPLEGVRP